MAMLICQSVMGFSMVFPEKNRGGMFRKIPDIRYLVVVQGYSRK